MSRTDSSALPRELTVIGEEGAFAYDDGCLSIGGSSPLIIRTNGPTTSWIHVRPGVRAYVTLENADIEPWRKDLGCPAILVDEGAVLSLTLAGVNLLESGNGRAGIELANSALVITEHSTGSLVTTSDYGAGIGGGIVGDECYGGTIIINGGNVYALAGTDSAGIGCGAGWPGTHPVSKGFDVVINGGSVCTRGSGTGAGIGGTADRPCGTITINGGCVHARAEGHEALGDTPNLKAYRHAHVWGEPTDETFIVRPLPLTIPAPLAVYDVSEVHAESIPWKRDNRGRFHARGFNAQVSPNHTNHACMDITYELDQPGAIAYRWKVHGKSHEGNEIFDRYWFLSGSDGSFRSGSDFLGESEDFNLHLIEDLAPGTYKLTLGVFCCGHDGSVCLDLSPCA